MITKRGLLRGMIAAPAVVHSELLMPLRGIIMPVISLATLTVLNTEGDIMAEISLTETTRKHFVSERGNARTMIAFEPTQGTVISGGVYARAITTVPGRSGTMDAGLTLNSHWLVAGQPLSITRANMDLIGKW